MKNLFVTALLMTLSTSIATANSNLKGHHHGNAKVEISADQNEIEIDFDAPSESILGFEHKPKTPSEKNAFNEAKNLWEKEVVMQIFHIAPALGCVVSKSKFEQDENHYKGIKDKNAPVHSEIEAELKLKCKNPVANSELMINLKKVYPKIQKLHIELNGSQMRTFESTNESETLTL